MKFGVQVNVHFSTYLDPSTAFDYAVKQTKAVKEGGFDGIFAAHHYALGVGESMFQPMPLLARLAAEAPGMTMGTASPRQSQEISGSGVEIPLLRYAPTRNDGNPWAELEPE